MVFCVTIYESSWKYRRASWITILLCWHFMVSWWKGMPCQTSSLSYIFNKKQRATSVRSRTFSKLNDSLRQSYTFSLKNIKVTLWSVDTIVRQLQSFYDGMLDDLSAHMHRHVLCMLSKRVSPDKLSELILTFILIPCYDWEWYCKCE